MLQLIGSAEGTIYGNSVQLMANVVDWSLEDRSLLAIRSRGHFNRTLPPLEQAEQAVIESVNYLVALIGIGFVFLWHRRRVNADRLAHAGVAAWRRCGMSGRIGLLGALLALQLVGLAALLLVDAGLGSEDQSSFLTIDEAGVNGMEILDAEGQGVTLQRSADVWELSVPSAEGAEFILPADQAKVTEVLGTLLDLRAPWPVGTTKEARDRFEVTEDAFQRKLTLADASGKAVVVFLGTSPGYRRVHARLAESDEVFSIDFSNYQLPSAAGDWLDGSLLGAVGEIAGIERLDGWVLTRDGEGWLLNDVAADQGAASQLAERLDGLRVTGLAELSAAGEVIGTGLPAIAEFLVSDAEGTYRLALFGSIEGNENEYVITSDRYPGGFTLAAYIAEQLMLDAEDLSAPVDESNGDSSTE